MLIPLEKQAVTNQQRFRTTEDVPSTDLKSITAQIKEQCHTDRYQHVDKIQWWGQKQTDISHRMISYDTKHVLGLNLTFFPQQQNKTILH